MKKILLAILLFLNYGFKTMKTVRSDASPISHQVWNDLLTKHVGPNGSVNYKGFLEDREQLDAYLSTLATAHPSDSWQKAEVLAYWINAYNAYTVDLILENYPISSIKKIKSKGLFAFTPWDIKFIRIGDERYSLGYIEHQVLRKMEEPRIHFAINCASVSCPKLRNEAYTAQDLDRQLDDQARGFINDPMRNRLSKEDIEISKIFSWFKGDFTEQGSLIDYLNQYAEQPISAKAAKSYMNYDWNLNE